MTPNGIQHVWMWLNIHILVGWTVLRWLLIILCCLRYSLMWMLHGLGTQFFVSYVTLLFQLGGWKLCGRETYLLVGLTEHSLRRFISEHVCFYLGKGGKGDFSVILSRLKSILFEKQLIPQAVFFTGRSVVRMFPCKTVVVSKAWLPYLCHHLKDLAIIRWLVFYRKNI